ncbi:hypothetical protein GR925_37845 [Streptomyces sp. HUCO-GS316]|uniref:hypothetical protein n=1 Tax=Streptomyces sp. HUCO-GS316 TaxID=2692198 RepID=UPI00136DE24D|nr:hypothetical protein [Streptomyces sp. HUCO-GS316]MXM69004.1 hypothetical protein [Streptomyces sp. HUCO-GS316]
MQNYYREEAGGLRWRTADDGGRCPPSRRSSPPTTRRWKDLAAHVTETCASGSLERYAQPGSTRYPSTSPTVPQQPTVRARTPPVATTYFILGMGDAVECRP